jgi:hypothetical protein
LGFLGKHAFSPHKDDFLLDVVTDSVVELYTLHLYGIELLLTNWKFFLYEVDTIDTEAWRHAITTCISCDVVVQGIIFRKKKIKVNLHLFNWFSLPRIKEWMSLIIKLEEETHKSGLSLAE